jgi:sugar lactone lactonase YvrE
MRLNGGIIGKDNSPVGNRASGIWGWREQEMLTVQNKFPVDEDIYFLENIPKFVSNTGFVAAIPVDIFFSVDGANVYIADNTLDNVYQYPLTVPWSVSTIDYSNVTVFYVGDKETTPTGLYFKDDGSTMYVVGSASDRVQQYSLSESWNVSSAIFNTFVAVGSQDTVPQAISFSPDGINMYIVGGTGDDVNQYTLSDAWNVESAVYTTVGYVGTEDTSPTGIFFKPEGEYIYVKGALRDNVYQYALSESWNIASLSFTQSFSIDEEETAPTGIFFKPDGTRMYITGSTGDDINEYEFFTPWDFRIPDYKIVRVAENTPRATYFKSDSSKMYIVDTSANVFQYSLSTAWDIESLSYDNKKYSLGGVNITSPRGLTFNADGTRMFVSGTGVSGSTAIISNMAGYELSTSWDITTASISSQLPSFSSSVSSYTGHYIDSSGSRLYIISTRGEIRYHLLRTPWDLSSTSTSAASRQVTSYNLYPSTSYVGIQFSNDGKILYLLSGLDDSPIHKYYLRTAWDLNTVRYSGITGGVLRLSDLDGPINFYLNSIDKKLYVIEGSNIAQLDLG